MVNLTKDQLVCVFEYKRHRFYEHLVHPEGKPLIHLDPKNQEIDSNVLDEMEAMEYVDNLS